MIQFYYRKTTIHIFLLLLAFIILAPQPLGALAQEEEAEPRATDLFSEDIAIIGFNSKPNNQLSFVLLENIGQGTEIKFTDNGWSDDLGLGQQEGTFTWTATQDMCAGSVVSLNFTTLDLEPGADQILAYQRSLTGRLSFLYGLNNVSNELDWDENGHATIRSAVPTGLLRGRSAISLGGPSYAAYSGPTAGSRAEILTAIATLSNWITSDQQPLNLPSRPFTITNASPCKICDISQERTYQFVGGLTAEVVSLGRFVTLKCIEVAFQSAAHPLAGDDPRYTLDGAHWRVTTDPQNAIGFQAHITLDGRRPITEQDKVCQLIATAPVQWECATPTSFFENSVTLRNFSQFHDIAIGRAADPKVEREIVPVDQNPLVLTAFLGVSGTFLLILLGVWLWLTRQYRRPDH